MSLLDQLLDLCVGRHFSYCAYCLKCKSLGREETIGDYGFLAPYGGGWAGLVGGGALVHLRPGQIDHLLVVHGNEQIGGAVTIGGLGDVGPEGSLQAFQHRHEIVEGALGILIESLGVHGALDALGDPSRAEEHEHLGAGLDGLGVASESGVIGHGVGVGLVGGESFLEQLVRAGHDYRIADGCPGEGLIV